MDEWSSSSTNPTKLWNKLKKQNSQLDESYFRLPNGRWDIARLNHATAEMDSGSRKKQKTENMRNNQQRFAIQQHNAIIQESVDARKLISSKEINLGGFQLGMVLFFAPVGLQLILLIALLSDLQNLFIYLTFIVLLNLVMWISIPIMTKSLANQIHKLDKRTKHLDNL